MHVPASAWTAMLTGVGDATLSVRNVSPALPPAFEGSSSSLSGPGGAGEVNVGPAHTPRASASVDGRGRGGPASRRYGAWARRFVVKMPPGVSVGTSQSKSPIEHQQEPRADILQHTYEYARLSACWPDWLDPR